MLRPLCLALAMFLPTLPALAQESSVERARRDLIDVAERARLAGDHSRALEYGMRAGQLRMTPSLRLLIAQEHDALGHTLDALDGAERCAREAEADPGARNREALLEACTSLRDRLAAGMGRVVVHVDAPREGTTVVLDGRVLGDTLWGTSIPALPGTIRVAATTADGRRFERELRVDRGQVVEVHVRFPSVQPLSSVPPPTRPAGGRGIGPWIVAGVGVTSFGLAGLFWGLHDGAIASRDGACDASGCDPVAIEHDARARDLTTLTNVALGAGAVATVSAVLWFVLTPRATVDASRGRAANLRWGLAATPQGAAVTFGGAL